MCHRLTTRFFLHSSLIPDCLVGSGPPYDSTVELGWVMCQGYVFVGYGATYSHIHQVNCGPM